MCVSGDFARFWCFSGPVNTQNRHDIMMKLHVQCGTVNQAHNTEPSALQYADAWAERSIVSIRDGNVEAKDTPNACTSQRVDKLFPTPQYEET